MGDSRPAAIDAVGGVGSATTPYRDWIQRRLIEWLIEELRCVQRMDRDRLMLDASNGRCTRIEHRVTAAAATSERHARNN